MIRFLPSFHIGGQDEVLSIYTSGTFNRRINSIFVVCSDDEKNPLGTAKLIELC